MTNTTGCIRKGGAFLKRAWWKEAVIYQIYPRSFKDTNGDGVGDLRGIIAKLDYLKELGVDVIWLNPIYASPNEDGGYDISDYQAIQPEFGTLADWEILIAGLHQRGMKLVMDLVVNHTSDEHAWFVEARTAKAGDKRDYYIWQPPGPDGCPPTNWRSLFAFSAWELDEPSGEYYLHLFSRKMPDLNWANPAVQRDIFAMMRWWLDKGVDGFRMDVINLLVKPPLLDAADPQDTRFYWNNEGIHGILRAMNREVLSHYDVFSVGECPEVTPALALAYVGEDRHELDMLFQFEHFEAVDKHGWDLVVFKQIQQRWYDALWGRGWNSQFLNNHDSRRAVSRYGNDRRYRVESAMLLGTMTHTLPGSPYIYQGEEIGMTDVTFPSIEQYRDFATLSTYREAVQNGEDPSVVLARLQKQSRDNARTPFQWDGSAHAGFSSSEPWLPVNPNYREINLQRDLSGDRSIFRHYQALIRLRKATPALVYGSYHCYDEADPHLYCYERRLEGERIIVALNLSDETRPVALPAGQLLLGNYADMKAGVLRPWEALLLRA